MFQLSDYIISLETFNTNILSSGIYEKEIASFMYFKSIHFITIVDMSERERVENLRVQHANIK